MKIRHKCSEVAEHSIFSTNVYYRKGGNVTERKVQFVKRCHGGQKKMILLNQYQTGACDGTWYIEHSGTTFVAVSNTDEIK